MADVMTKEQRSKNMKKMKASDTKIELLLRNALWTKGIRYRKNVSSLPGKPDIVITKYKIAVFCDGEFFHGKDWETLKNKLKNSNNGEFWIKKISRNIERDEMVNNELLSQGYTVIRFWGNEIIKDTEECVRAIEEAIFESKLIDEQEDWKDV